jgi:hypothetical protein
MKCVSECSINCIYIIEMITFYSTLTRASSDAYRYDKIMIVYLKKRYKHWRLKHVTIKICIGLLLTFLKSIKLLSNTIKTCIEIEITVNIPKWIIGRGNFTHVVQRLERRHKDLMILVILCCSFESQCVTLEPVLQRRLYKRRSPDVSQQVL